ncbi:hypothetical protein ABZ442_20255 [Streptomyces triculaminicus]|uniref:hypothetical protein n=1 Tax=Streptomyces triculaminicus TaxID=2816232 RepID=UPI0033C6A118
MLVTAEEAVFGTPEAVNKLGGGVRELLLHRKEARIRFQRSRNIDPEYYAQAKAAEAATEA